ncbi:ABC transporter substrate-binding protein [Actinomadura sp. NBRC 104412]|uniref:extracellular solute-binding protein n=1 Tax=Actinomadura sp. NBRC 104412 TaxID=3032203 RepID=UPI0024A5A980|nr:extracellular solute-binding protein [Actinomadura sp. NBRC 104412]GLZ07909.1 ABC transporter substrate-binding protein [Actinomadura sp. NBRC 104412]
MTSSLRTAALSRRGFLGLTGGVAAMGALAACGGTSGSGGGSGTLRLVGVADQQKAVEAVLKGYTRAKFSTSFAPTDQVQTSVRTQLGAGNAPDVHVVYPGNGSAMSMVQISQAGLLADLSDQAWTKRIPAGLKPAFQNNGKTFIYSAGSSVIGAIYNKKVFQEAEVEPPKTWSEFLEVCDKIKKKGKTPIALGAQTPWITQLITYALVPSTVYAKNPQFDQQMKAGSASFANSGWVQALEMYLDLQKRGFFNDNPNGTTFEQQTAMVATGKAAMAIQVSAVLPDFRKAAPSPDDLSMFPVPGADDAAQVWIPAGVVVGLGASARSKNLEEAKAFLEYLGEQKTMNTWAEAVACVPLSRDAGSKIDPVLEPFLPFIDGNKAVPFMDQAWPNAEVQPAHFAAVQELLGGRTTIPKALAKMDEIYRKTQ